MSDKFNTLCKRITASLLTLCMLLCGIQFLVSETEAITGDPYTQSPPLHGKWTQDNYDGTYDLKIAVAGARKFDANIVLVMDVSTSMKNNYMTDLTGNASSTAMNVLLTTAQDFINTIYDGADSYATETHVNMALVRYAGNGEIMQMWTDNKSTLLYALNRLATTGLSGNTNCQSGLYLANELYECNTISGLDTNRPTNLDVANNFIVFMTDGAPNRCYIQSGTQTLTKNNDSYSISGDNETGKNVATVDATIVRPTTVVSSGYVRTDGLLSRSATGTDYRNIAAYATLQEAVRSHENPTNITMLSVGLGRWFTANDEDSNFPTSVNFTRLVTAVGNGTITLAEAGTELGPDIGAGAMPSTNPPYPIIDTVDGVYLGDSFYDRWKSGSRYVLDGNLTNLTLEQLKEWIEVYYGTVAVQMLDGIYRLSPITRGNEVIDVVASTQDKTYFGDTAVAFNAAFDDIAGRIISGYTEVRVSDALSRNVEISGGIPAADEARMYFDAERNAYVIDDPSFIDVTFYIHASSRVHLGDTDLVSLDTQLENFILDGNPPARSRYVTRYIRTNEAQPVEYLELEFDSDYMLRDDHIEVMSVTVQPTQYCIDTYYNNLNNSSFSAQGYGVDDVYTKTDGIDPQLVGTSTDTNGYPDEAFYVNYVTDADGVYLYDASGTALLASRIYDTGAEKAPVFGFFTNTRSESYLDFSIENLNSGYSGLLHTPLMMPVISPELIDVPVTKIWHDTDDTLRQSIMVTATWQQDTYSYTVDSRGVKQVTVTGSETKSQTITLSADNNWQNNFTDLPQGHTFTLTETDLNGDPISGFTAEWRLGSDVISTSASLTGNQFTINRPCVSSDLQSGLILCNEQLVEKTVTKVWVDNNNSLNRPESVTIMLFKNGDPYREVVIANPNTGANTWTYTFTDLPMYNMDGSLVVYTVTETSDLNTVMDEYGNPVSDYSVTVEQATLTITNTDPGQLTDRTVSKVWNDNDDRDGIRPTSLDVSLYADGVLVDTQTLSADNNWSYQWTNLAVKANNTRIQYTVTEEAVADYTLSTNYNGSYVTLTNTHVPELIDLPVEKIWVDNDNQDGLRSASVRVQLYRNGVAVNGAILVLEPSNDWMGSFENLHKYENGVECVYTVNELSVSSDYTVAIVFDNNGGYTITNSYTPRTIDLTVKKIWNDGGVTSGRTASITYQLYVNGVASGSAQTLDASNNWQYTYEDLPARANGIEIIYSVVETSVPSGYQVSYVNVGDERRIINTSTTSRTITKVWNDNNNADGLRPDHVWIQLLQNGSPYSVPSNLSATNNWTFVWGVLPKYDADGNEYVYSIEEDTTGNVGTFYAQTYSSNGSTLTVTNTQDQANIDIEINKSWNSGEGEEALLDAVFSIYRTATVTSGNTTTTIEDNVLYQTVTISGADNWTTTVSLPQWQTLNGDRYDYTYTVVESQVRLALDSTRFTSFTNNMSSNSQYVSSVENTGNVWDFVNHRPLSTVGCQAHVIHQTQALDTYPLYTDGIRFAYDLSMSALNAMLDPGDLFTFGYLVYPKTMLDAALPTGVPTYYTADDYMMHLNITNHVWSSTFGESVVYCARASAKSTTINANSTVTWTAAMENAANANDIDTLISLMAAAECVIYEKIDSDSMRIVAHLMFSQTNETLRLTQANTVLSYRGFLLMQRDGVDSVVYTMQRQNSAARIFDSYRFEFFEPDYDNTDDADGIIGLGISDYFPTVDIQAMP